jgi:polysaccharide export outer membrane protein
MFSYLARCTIACVALTCVASTGSAQQRPSPQEAEALLRSNPDLAAQVRSRLRDSGMTPEQVRARLRAEGYPESLLDSYLQPSGAAGTDSVPSASVIAALRALSVAPDSLDQGVGRSPSPPVPEGPPRPTITCDTVAVAPV